MRLTRAVRIGFGGVLVAGAIVAALARVMSVIDAVRIVIGVPFLLFVPGYAVTCIAFPAHDVMDGRTHRDARFPRPALDLIERMTFAVLFSIVVTSGVVYALASARTIAWVGTLTPRMLTEAVVAVNIALGTLALWRTRRCAAIVAVPAAIASLAIFVAVIAIHA